MYKRQHFLHLTDVGREVAEKIYERHCFFTEQLITAGVDPKTAEEMCIRDSAYAIADFRQLLFTLKSQGKTIIISEQRLYYLSGLFDRVLYLKDGEIEGDYTCLLYTSCRPFLFWKGGPSMATTRIMPLHIGKGRTESRAISEIGRAHV